VRAIVRRCEGRTLKTSQASGEDSRVSCAAWGVPRGQWPGEQ
jgi:hypothetical protein